MPAIRLPHTVQTHATHPTAPAMNAANATTAPSPSLGRSSGFGASVLPELHRSEAFVEDLFDSSSFAPERGRRGESATAGRWNTVLLCGVPLLVALLGGALAFIHGLG
jgi:hypothetical protein